MTSRSARVRRTTVLALLVALLALDTSAGAVAAYRAGRPSPTSTFLVQSAAKGAGAAAAAVAETGGAVLGRLALVEGVVARLTPDQVAGLAGDGRIATVTPDRSLSTRGAYDGFAARDDAGSLLHVAAGGTGARSLWSDGVTGRSVDVALIDTGVADVPGLDAGNVVHGPDFSSEGADPATATRDGYGHGTHLAAIIAGRDADAPAAVDPADDGRLYGVAPEARVVSVKVADRQGRTDVSDVIAALDWVVSNARSGGLNIRVVNLALGMDPHADPNGDPLARAVEAAWRAGLVVVTSAGNGGDVGRLDAPAYAPRVLAVGATDSGATVDPADDVLADFSACGDGTRNPDLVAPGRSIVSARAVGSVADLEHPEGHVTPTLMRGSGTSQAAAVVAGASALLLQAYPELTPDEVKDALTRSARPLDDVAERCQGAGRLDVAGARTLATHRVRANTLAYSAGRGRTDASAGTRGGPGPSDAAGDVPARGGVGPSAQGEGAHWTGARWTGARWTGARWTGARWTGARWTGARWTGARWTGARWTGARWTGARWTGARWTGARWTGARWTGARWT